MVKIPPFEVEQWMDKYETTPGVLNVAETCAASVSIEKLVVMNRLKTLAPPPVDFSRPMTYGAILGSDELRRNITKIYEQRGPPSPIAPEDIIVTQGAIAANFLLFYTIVGPGDHVICVYPTYQQLYSVPETLGAEVSLWKLKAENGFLPDVTELEGLLKANTKVGAHAKGTCIAGTTRLTTEQMIVINNPNNPTGAVIPNDVLVNVVELARKHDIIVLSDEVYRPLFHSVADDEIPPSALPLGYDKVIITSSMSKAWSLAGVRVGWIACCDASILRQVAAARDYTAISVSQVDDQIAAYALSDDVRPQLLSRNIALARTNLALLTRFVEAHADVCDWVRPHAGTTAFLRFKRKDGGEPVDDVAFCRDLLQRTKVLLVPGSLCFGGGADFRGYVRIGFVCETEVVEEALPKLSAYVKEYLAS
ncbi:hypothetical protein DL766_003653 [Monosporascus sp. MC13-8B]|uniref:Aminotransferase class I/classII large domain-containing protein n=1 Tax=Monosporascus cannonballus TaxID=155416 RepID=A0ABY0H6C5_9PEZI|nr:hypothetical protein DL763_009745 [Monosporascus cannonballus]RYO86060.1 hypothetical protein DL762_004938 [Monosporascus cannonballus]RYP33153.1 hypothetical protein DL766_003653 [Monosporascus sp. MC13-8B]